MYKSNSLLISSDLIFNSCQTLSNLRVQLLTNTKQILLVWSQMLICYLICMYWFTLHPTLLLQTLHVTFYIALDHFTSNFIIIDTTCNVLHYTWPVYIQLHYSIEEHWLHNHDLNTLLTIDINSCSAAASGMNDKCKQTLTVRMAALVCSGANPC